MSKSNKPSQNPQRSQSEVPQTLHSFLSQGSASNNVRKGTNQKSENHTTVLRRKKSDSPLDSKQNSRNASNQTTSGTTSSSFETPRNQGTLVSTQKQIIQGQTNEEMKSQQEHKIINTEEITQEKQMETYQFTDEKTFFTPLKLKMKDDYKEEDQQKRTQEKTSECFFRTATIGNEETSIGIGDQTQLRGQEIETKKNKMGEDKKINEGYSLMEKEREIQNEVIKMYNEITIDYQSKELTKILEKGKKAFHHGKKKFEEGNVLIMSENYDKAKQKFYEGFDLYQKAMNAAKEIRAVKRVKEMSENHEVPLEEYKCISHLFETDEYNDLFNSEIFSLGYFVESAGQENESKESSIVEVEISSNYITMILSRTKTTSVPNFMMDLFNKEKEKENKMTEEDKVNVILENMGVIIYKIKLIYEQGKDKITFKVNTEEIRANFIKKTCESLQKKYGFTFDNSTEVEKIAEEYIAFVNEMTNLIQRESQIYDGSALTLNKLDKNSSMNLLRYVETIEDVVNFMMMNKKCLKIMKSMKYNPVSVSERTIGEFPQLEELHLYNEEDKVINGGNFKRIVDWRKHQYSEYLEMKLEERKKHENEMEFVDRMKFKCVELTRYEKEKYIEEEIYSEDDISFHDGCLEWRVKQNDITDRNVRRIPAGVTIVGEYCYANFNTRKKGHYENEINRIGISGGVRELGRGCFLLCTSLTGITIPSSIISIREGCFYGCSSLRELIIPHDYVEIKENIIGKCHSLTKLVLPRNWTLHGDRAFNNDVILLSIEIPKSLEIFGNKNVIIEPLTSYVIPERSKALGNACFHNCTSLTRIDGLERIKKFNQGCFMNCPSLKEEKIIRTMKKMSFLLDVDFINILEISINMKLDEVIYDNLILYGSHDENEINEMIDGRSNLLFLIEFNRKRIIAYCPDRIELPKSMSKKKRIETNGICFLYDIDKEKDLSEKMSMRQFAMTFFPKHNKRVMIFGDYDAVISKIGEESYVNQRSELFGSPDGEKETIFFVDSGDIRIKIGMMKPKHE